MSQQSRMEALAYLLKKRCSVHKNKSLFHAVQDGKTIATAKSIELLAKEVEKS